MADVVDYRDLAVDATAAAHIRTKHLRNHFKDVLGPETKALLDKQIEASAKFAEELAMQDLSK